MNDPLSPDAMPPRPRTSRWVKILLGLSLALNLAVIGLVGGVALRFAGKGPVPRALEANVPHIAALDRADRLGILNELRRLHGDARTARRSRHTELLGLLRAQAYDPDAVRSALEADARSRTDMHRRMQAAWLSRVNAMSPQERRIYADRLEQALRRGPARKR